MQHLDQRILRIFKTLQNNKLYCKIKNPHDNLHQ
jgi:hypothetical protein